MATALIAPASTLHAMQPCSPNELTAERWYAVISRWYAVISRPQAHSDKTTATALNSTATQSDETYSSSLAMINGEPGPLYQRHEGNASAASSEQVIASAGTKWRPWRALSATPRPVSLASGRGDLSRLPLNVPAQTCLLWSTT